MRKYSGFICILLCLPVFTITVYTQESGQGENQQERVKTADISAITVKSDITLTPAPDVSHEKLPFLKMINTAYAAPLSREDDKEYLRREWQELLGMDVFMPYFKAKDVEGWVKEKAHIKFFKIKGEPQLRSDQIQYIFNINF